jgi:hypothetical protein
VAVVGNAEGVELGAALGDSLGVTEGVPEGMAVVGNAEGVELGAALGATVGIELGDSVGFRLTTPTAKITSTSPVRPSLPRNELSDVPPSLARTSRIRFCSSMILSSPLRKSSIFKTIRRHGSGEPTVHSSTEYCPVAIALAITLEISLSLRLPRMNGLFTFCNKRWI